MRILNLADSAKSSLGLEYEVLHFPDGQQDIRLEHEQLVPQFQERILIKSRFNNFGDLELIIAAMAALRRAGAKDVQLSIPYILGARSDRQFVKGGTSYLVDVVAPILRAQNFNYITSLDTHSDVAAACIPYLDVASNAAFVEWAIEQSGSTNYVLAIPDAGALKKFYGLAEELKYTGPVIVGQKHRDLATGKIISTSVDVPNTITDNQDVFIVDDICDGGRTFLELAKALKEHPYLASSTGKYYLIVTHGIFSAGYKELGKVFEQIYCTNSVKDVASTDYDGYNTWPTKVTQLDVF